MYSAGNLRIQPHVAFGTSAQLVAGDIMREFMLIPTTCYRLAACAARWHCWRPGYMVGRFGLYGRQLHGNLVLPRLWGRICRFLDCMDGMVNIHLHGWLEFGLWKLGGACGLVDVLLFRAEFANLWLSAEF